MNKDYPFVSVVIPVKNEEAHINKCINSILNQNYDLKLIEIIIVDNGSTDQTIGIIKRSSPENLRLFEGVEGTIGAIRNFGAKESNGDIVAFIDGDCVADPDWLIIAVKMLLNDATIGCIGFTDLERDREFPWVQQAWQHICSTSKCEGCGDVSWLSSFNLVLWSKFFEKIGRFREDLETCEDVELGYRIRKLKRLIMCDILHIHHLGESKSLLEFFRKEYWRGKNNLKVFLKSANKSHDVISVVVPALYLVLCCITFISILIWPFITESTFNFSALIIVLLIATFLIPIILTAIKSSRISSAKRFFQVAFLLFVYLIARGLSIFY